MADYLFEISAQQWRTDPYYVASSAPVHKLEVVASTEAEARTEAKQVLGAPGDYHYWRMWIARGRDVRLIPPEPLASLARPRGQGGEA